jgi:hypothetical protein
MAVSLANAQMGMKTAMRKLLSVSAGPMIAEYFTVQGRGVASLTGFAPTEGVFSMSFSLFHR